MSTNEETRQAYEPTRRGFLAGMVAGSALFAIAPAALLGSKEALGSTLKQTAFLSEWAAIDRDVFRYFQSGTGIVHDWFISETTFESGAIVLSLTGGDGSDVRIDICEKSGDGEGIESTDHFDLFVMNDGGGATDTETDCHQPVRILAEVLRRTEVDLTGAPSQMKNHVERLALIEAKALSFPAQS